MTVWPLATLSGGTVLRFAERELLFLFGVHFAAYAPDSYLTTLLRDPRSLRTAWLAALRIGGAVGATDPSVEQTVKRLAQRMVPAQVHALSKICGLLAIDLPHAELEDVLLAASERWLGAVAKTRARAGLLLCDELSTALDLLAQLGPPWSAPPLREDLERFWVSEELSTLRAALGR